MSNRHVLILGLFGALVACGPTDEPAETETAAGEPEKRGFLSKVFRSEPERVTVPAGTVVVVRFEDTLSSHTSQADQGFRVSVVQEVSVEGRLAIPSGSVVLGAVTEARGPKKVGGRARLSLDFHTLELPSGVSLPIQAAFAQTGKSETPKDAAIIGGSTLGGAILGEAVDEGEGTIVGAIVGGLAGTAAAIKTRGKPVEVPEGTVMSLELTGPVTIELGS